MATRHPYAIDEVVAQLRTLGVSEGGILLVHSSFGAAHPIEGGPDGLIEALTRSLGPGGTLVMPSWTGDDETPFDPAATEPAGDLGILPRRFWRLPDVRRSGHPFAFAARGRRAEPIVADPLPAAPHTHASPVGRVFDEGGQILLIGVGHDANTTLHLAEHLAGVPYSVPKHITVLRDGAPLRIDYRENDHCCTLFALADDWLRDRGAQREGTVGNAAARLMRSRQLIDIAVGKLKADPTAFLHPHGTGCEECDEAWAGISGSDRG